jgi:RNA polymerase sigma factor (sigma-70 family)
MASARYLDSSRARHAGCLGARVKPLQAPPASPARRLPRHVTVLRRLSERGVALEVLPAEDPDLFEARIETALMALVRDGGGESAFQALYDYARGRLYLWIVGLSSRHGPDPLEVLQDTFVNVYRYAQGFRDDEPKSFRVWSRTIAGNLVRRARANLSLGSLGLRSLDALPVGLQEPADRRRGPVDELAGDEESRSMLLAWTLVLLQYARAYQQLGARDRRALDLIEVQGLSYAEAGARLGVGLSNMKMIMFRSRRRIRSLIAAQFVAARARPVSLAG